MNYSFLKASLYSFLFLSLSSHADSGKYNFFVNYESFQYSEIAPIDQVKNDLLGQRVKSGEHLIATEEGEIGLSYQNLSFSFVSRLHVLMDFTPDTALIFWHDRNNVRYERGREYNLELHARYMTASGVKLGYSKSVDLSVIHLDKRKLNFLVSGSYLEARRMAEGRLIADAFQPQGGDSAEVQAHLDYHYNKDLFFKRPENDIRGSGYTLDFGFDVQITDKLWLQYFAKDFSSSIVWPLQYQTIASIESETVSYDDEGRLNVTPSLSWLETENDFTQKLPKRNTLVLEYALFPSHVLKYENITYETITFNRIGYRYQPSDVWAVEGRYDIKAEAYSLGIASKYMSLSFMSESSNLKEAHTYSVDASIRIPF